ncbi:MAG TPA: mechanosensitive ion channel protein MscS [Elusimicrobia bacterium]|nr:mechanosensitive ion channel protein MscS [Elusimicrobiota bacterium]
MACFFSLGKLLTLLALFGSIGALYAAAPASRKRLSAVGLMAVGGTLGILLCALLCRFGAGQSTAFRVIDGASYLLLALSAVNVAGVLAFDLLLPVLRLNIPVLLHDLILAGAYLLAVFAMLSRAGANLTGLLATSAVVTAVIAFSLQDTLGNIMGGMVLQFEDSFGPGDWLNIGPEEGFVKEIRWRHTTLVTPSGRRIIIPNSALMKGTVSVTGRSPDGTLRRLMKVAFNVYYDRAPNEVIEAVEGALREDPPPGVAASPQPWCVLIEMKESCSVYAIRYWLTDLTAPESVGSAVRVRVYYALSRAGIKLSVPVHAVVVNQKDEDVVERSRRLEAERRLAALRGVDILQPLNQSEINVLCERLRPAPFAKGEAITRQGAAAHWLYIVVKGEAEARLYAPEGEAFQSVGTLRPGDFLGEMGLMTGEPRTATVIALSDVLCYRLDRDSFADVLARRPEIAESISALLAKRKLGLEAAKGGLAQDAERQRLDRTQDDFLSRIRSLFALG